MTTVMFAKLYIFVKRQIPNRHAMNENFESCENEFARFFIRDGILYFEYRDGVAIGVEAAVRVVEDRISFQGGRLFPVLCDMRGIASIDKPARDYLARSGSQLAVAVALLVDESMSLTIGKFYLEISRPAVATRLFTDRSAALEFLKKSSFGEGNLELPDSL